MVLTVSHFARRRGVAILAIAIIVLLSWLDVIDAQIRAYLDETILQTGLLFASARAMNGIISLLQSAEVGVAVSINPGELLDPLNDTIEWFSDIMKFALSSAIGQKIILEVVGTDIFKWGNLIAGGVLIAYLLSEDSQRWLAGLFRLFLTFAFLRFALLAVFLAASLVDAAFLDKKIRSDMETIDAAENSFSEARRRQAMEKENIDLKSEVGRLEGEAAEVEKLLPSLRQRRDTDRINLNAKSDKMGLMDKFGLFNSNPEYEQLQAKMATSQAALNQAEEKLDGLEERLNAVRRKMDANRKALAGETNVGLIEGLADRAAYLMEDLSFDRMESEAQNAMTAMVNVVSALFIKIVLIPLVFFWAAIKGFKALWQVDPRFLVRRGLDNTRRLSLPPSEEEQSPPR